MRLPFLFVYIFSFFFTLTIAQQKPFQTNKAAQFTYRETAKYNVKYIDVEHGLSSSFIRTICEDSVGNLLLGTWGGGLMKYDGVTIDINNTYSGLPENSVKSVLKFQNEYKILFERTGLYTYKNTVFTPVKLNTDSFYIAAQFNVKNQTWILANDSLLYYVLPNNSLLSLNKTKKIPYCKISQITEINGVTWIASSVGLISVLKDGSIKIYNSANGFPSDKISAFVFKNNTLVFSCVKGVFLSDLKNKIRPLLFKNDTIKEVSKIILDKQNNVWMGSTKTAAYRWDGENFIHLNVNNGLTNNEVWSLYCDKFNNVWIGPRAGGLCRFDGDYITHFDANDGISGKVVWSLAYNKTKKIYYFGTIGGGVTVYDGINFTPAPFNSKLPHQSIRAMFCDSKQNLWIGTAKGIACFNENGKFIDYSEIPEVGKTLIYKFTEDEKGVVWINAVEAGVVCFSNNKFYKPFVNPFLNNYAASTSTCFTKNGETWIGFESGVIALNNKEQKVQTAFTDSVKSVGLCVFEDSKNRIWVGTRAGIYIKTPSGNIHITQLDGLSSDIVWSLGEDKEGNIWAGTEYGLSKITLNKNQFKIEVIGINEGFTGGDCTLNGLLIDDKGIFWWGTSKKLTRFNPEKYVKRKLSPSLQLKNILINYIETIDLFSNKNTFSYNQNHLTFQVSAIDWGNETKLKYQYQLIGFEKQFSPKTAEDKITYSNLPPGKYTLRVIAISNSGLESNILKYSFIIEPAFWQTLWFKILIALLIVSGLIFFYKYRTYSLVQKKEILEKTVKERTAEIVLQKHLVEEKNKEILDSINYAKRLQEAILPPLKLVQKHLENSFILYKPKDIVAGDFYWFEPKDDLLLFAAADCTGHGVPGAMVSVVCSNALNRTVKEFGIIEPGKILDKVRELVVETFEKSESEVKDGMDISLCALNLKTKELFWSGANNPLWIIREGNADLLMDSAHITHLNNHFLVEYKADKQPIGKTDNNKLFTTQKIHLDTGYTFYIFTDGYADQFGGSGGKKYKSANFKKMLLSIQDKSMNEQRQLINTEFEKWRGTLEQVDDVCVIGVRV